MGAETFTDRGSPMSGSPSRDSHPGQRKPLTSSMKGCFNRFEHTTDEGVGT